MGIRNGGIVGLRAGGGRRRAQVVAIAAGLVVAVLTSGGEASGQAGKGRIEGVVRSEGGTPVAQAQVFVPDVGRGTLSDSQGRFTLEGLPAGRHVVHVGRIGYAPERRSIELVSGAAESLEIVLESTPLTLPGIHVTGYGRGRDPLAVVQATTQLAGMDLERELGATLAATLKAQPGISSRTMGPAASMPIMRGLTGDRILILQDGQRTGDLAGSADDHGVTIDPLMVERIEVIRGPATLLYGNNALGGVVNVISGDADGTIPDRPAIRAGMQTETAYPGASAGLRATLPLGSRWALNLRGAGRTVGDMRIPEDPALGTRLENTEARSSSAAAGLEYAGPRANGSASMQRYDFGYGIPVPPGADPVSLRGRRNEASGRVEVSLAAGVLRSLRLDATAQDYSHDEIDDVVDEVAQSFVLETRTVNLLLRQGRIGKIVEGAWGVSGLFKSYAAAGPAALTPPAESRGLGVFAFQEISLGFPALELGARYDDYRIASRDEEKFGPGRARSFPALSGSAGLRIPLGKGASGGVSVARSFRAPTVEELFSGAAHAGTGAVEFGNPELEAERGLSVETVVRLQRSRWNGQIAAYRSEIGNYVHLAAAGDSVIGGVRLPVLTYTQARAVLQGVEGSMEWAPSSAVVLGAMGDYLHAERRDGTPLSYMPPPRLGASARWDGGTVHVGADLHHELRQNRIGAADELPTPAHTILRLHGGLRFHLGSQTHSLVLRVENLTDELHREATSRIKDFAPGPGRNLAITYRVTF